MVDVASQIQIELLLALPSLGKGAAQIEASFSLQSKSARMICTINAINHKEHNVYFLVLSIKYVYNQMFISTESYGLSILFPPIEVAPSDT